MPHPPQSCSVLSPNGQWPRPVTSWSQLSLQCFLATWSTRCQAASLQSCNGTMPPQAPLASSSNFCTFTDSVVFELTTCHSCSTQTASMDNCGSGRLYCSHQRCCPGRLSPPACNAASLARSHSATTSLARPDLQPRHTPVAWTGPDGHDACARPPLSIVTLLTLNCGASS